MKYIVHLNTGEVIECSDCTMSAEGMLVLQTNVQAPVDKIDVFVSAHAWTYYEVIC